MKAVDVYLLVYMVDRKVGKVTVCNKFWNDDCEQEILKRREVLGKDITG